MQLKTWVIFYESSSNDILSFWVTFCKSYQLKKIAALEGFKWAMGLNYLASLIKSSSEKRSFFFEAGEHIHEERSRGLGWWQVEHESSVPCQPGGPAVSWGMLGIRGARVAVPLCIALEWPHLRHCVQFWMSQPIKDIKLSEPVWRAELVLRARLRRSGCGPLSCSASWPSATTPGRQQRGRCCLLPGDHGQDTREQNEDVSEEVQAEH